MERPPGRDGDTEHVVTVPPVVEVGEKKWSLEAEYGLPEFFVG